MKNSNFLSKLAGIILILVVMAQNAAAGAPQTPYQQLQVILGEYYINKQAVTDELTASEIERVSVDVSIHFKVPESVVKRSKTVGEMLTNILEYKYAGKRGSEWEWRRIQYSSKCEDYALFVFCYPKSKHLAEACSKFFVTKLSEMFLSLGETDSVDKACHEYLGTYWNYSYVYEMFIRNYECDGCGIQCIDYEGFSFINPGEWAAAIEEYLQEKDEERQAWKAVIRDNTHDAYWDYYVEYPHSETADTALERARGFEQAAWDKASEAGNREAYEVFVKQFPQGVYSPEAYRRVVYSHLDTTVTDAVENSLTERCYLDKPGQSLICLGNVNKEKKRYTVTFSGDFGYRLELEPGEIKWLEVQNGDYVVLVEADGVKPWWGNVSCYGYLYAEAWYVKTEYYDDLHVQIRRPINLKANSFHPDFFKKEMTFPKQSAADDAEIDQEAAERFVRAVEEQCGDNE